MSTPIFDSVAVDLGYAAKVETETATTPAPAEPTPAIPAAEKDAVRELTQRLWQGGTHDTDSKDSITKDAPDDQPRDA